MLGHSRLEFPLASVDGEAHDVVLACASEQGLEAQRSGWGEASCFDGLLTRKSMSHTYHRMTGTNSSASP